MTRSDDGDRQPTSGIGRGRGGAKLLIVVNDQAGKLMDWVGQDDGSDSAVPVISVTASDRAPVSSPTPARRFLTVVGTPNSPYVYDLVDPHPGQIPTNLTYRPKASDLATVDMKFYGTTQYASGEFRWDYRPYRRYGAGFWLKTDMPGVRTDYVSAQPGTSWASSAVTGPNFSLVSSGDIEAFRRGSRTTSDWFSPIVRPRDGGGFWSSQRDSALDPVQRPAVGGRRRRPRRLPDRRATTEHEDLPGRHPRLGVGMGVRVAIPGSDRHLDLQAGSARLTRRVGMAALAEDAHGLEGGLAAGHRSERGRPDAADAARLPDPHRSRRPRRKAAGRRCSLSARHLPGAVGTGKITSGSLSVSYDDGVTWHKIVLTKTAEGEWTARFKAPSHGFRVDQGQRIGQPGQQHLGEHHSGVRPEIARTAYLRKYRRVRDQRPQEASFLGPLLVYSQNPR